MNEAASISPLIPGSRRPRPVCRSTYVVQLRLWSTLLFPHYDILVDTPAILPLPAAAAVLSSYTTRWTSEAASTLIVTRVPLWPRIHLNSPQLGLELGSSSPASIWVQQTLRAVLSSTAVVDETVCATSHLSPLGLKPLHINLPDPRHMSRRSFSSTLSRAEPASRLHGPDFHDHS